MPEHAAASRLPHGLRRAAAMLAHAARDWLATEGVRWNFVAKTLLAGVGALWLAYRFGLDSPGTALTTVLIVALPSSGMVLEKSAYRLLGTIVGCVAALALVGMFAQHAALYFLVLALWVGLCTSGATSLRNAQSYSCVLAGYTACMIAIPAIDQPNAAFALAVTRLSEVGLGVLCGALVNDGLFPRHQHPQLMRAVQARQQRFLAFCHDVLAHRLSPAQAELSHLAFAADIAAGEQGRAAALFEATHTRADSRAVHAYNAALMAALTTLYTLHRLLHRVRQSHGEQLAALTGPMAALVSRALAGGASGAQLDAADALLAPAQAEARARFEASMPSREQRIDFDTALELMARFMLRLHAVDAAHRAIGQPAVRSRGAIPAYSPSTPPAIVAANGVRTAAALGLMALGWYHLDWPFAGTTIVLATIFCGLASLSARPTAMVGQILTGFLIACPLALLSVFVLEVRAQGYPMLVLCMLPMLALGSYVTAVPSKAGIGIGINLFAAQMLAPANAGRMDPVAFMSMSLALVLGAALAYLVFRVLLPAHTSGRPEHVAAALWREALATCRAAPRRLGQRFDNRMRDLLSQLNAAAGPVPAAATRGVLAQALTLLELGHSVIELRQLIAGAAPGPVRSALEHCVAQLANYLRAPTAARASEALDAILQAGPPVRAAHASADAERAARLQAVLADLHSIYTSLLDQAAKDPAGALHAA